MDLEEAKSLIPVYLNGTLSLEERQAVEDLLRNSKELQEELAFWHKAREAVRLDASHLSPEQIVDYAERVIVDEKSRVAIESHLQSCNECRDEYSIALETLHRRDTPFVTPSLLGRVRPFFASVRFRYAIPIAAAVIASIVVWRYFTVQEGEQIIGEPAVKGDFRSAQFSARLVLPLQNVVRSGKEAPIPAISLADSISTLHLLVCIQADNFRGVKYTARLTDPNGVTALLPDTASKSVRVTSPVDTLIFSMGKERFALSPGNYTLNVFEVPPSLPKGIDAFPLEPYMFRIERDAMKQKP